MALPVFFSETIAAVNETLVLDEDTSRHIVQVLRMPAGAMLQLTDGKGHLIGAAITDAHKKKCTVQIKEIQNKEPGTRNISIAISLVKNASRFEWFLEKATEIGVHCIIPLLCERTEKQHFRYERMKGILVSAMLQSQQVWLPKLLEPTSFQGVVRQATDQQKFIAHCIEEEKRNLADLINENLSSQLILIGPEGDFAPAEIELAIRHHFLPVALGNTRLRTETAGVVAATLLAIP